MTQFTTRAALMSLLCVVAVACSTAQQKRDDTLPAAVQWTLGAATPVQRTAITSVFLLYCPKTHMKGTGFLLKNGLIVTNNHVVEGCTKDDMLADPLSNKFGFTKMATDANRDLLCFILPSILMAGWILR